MAGRKASGPAVVEPRAGDAFEAMRSAFQLASRQYDGPPVERSYLFAGRAARFRIVGSELAARVHAPLLHLETQAAAPDLTVEVWDDEPTEVPAPTESDGIDASSRFPFSVSPDDRFAGHRWPRTLAWLDRRERRMVAVVSGTTLLSNHELGRPLEPLLLVWLRDRGVQLVHASLVSCEGDGVLFLGRSGIGKSTAAVAGLLGGLDFVGDDKVGLLGSGGDFSGHSLGCGAFLDAGQLERFPELASHAVSPRGSRERKWLIVLSRSLPARLAARTTIRALALPAIAPDGSSSLRAASRKEAFLAAALSTVLSLPIDRSRSVDRLAELANHIPAYRVELGTRTDEMALQVERLLDAARGCTTAG